MSQSVNHAQGALHSFAKLSNRPAPRDGGPNATFCDVRSFLADASLIKHVLREGHNDDFPYRCLCMDSAPDVPNPIASPPHGAAPSGQSRDSLSGGESRDDADPDAQPRRNVWLTTVLTAPRGPAAQSATS